MTLITLLQPHRHAGRDYPAGSTLTRWRTWSL
ncbi:DUF7210 family protein [Comamonas badia]